jgi:hypothetical protein
MTISSRCQAERIRRQLPHRKQLYRESAGFARGRLTGIRVRNYPITLDKLLDQLPDV